MSAATLLLLLLAVLVGAASALTDKPNILMIPIDDLNNWVSCYVVWLVIYFHLRFVNLAPFGPKTHTTFTY